MALPFFNNAPPNQSSSGSGFRHDTNYARGVIIVVPFGYRKSNIPAFSGPIPFLMNPENLPENLQGGWVHKSVPGQNDPVSGWVGNGARTVTLSLLLRKDITDLKQNPPAAPSVENPIERTVLGAIGSALAKIPIPVLQNLLPKEPAVAAGPGQSLDISNELDQLRQLRYGELYKGGLYSTPPSLIKFQFSGTKSGSNSNVKNPTLGVNGLENVYWTVDDIQISTSLWSSDLQPLESEVKLTLTQFNDINRSRK